MPNLDRDFYLDKQGLRQLVNELETNIVASEYDTYVSYSVGQYCIYENNFYRCTTATTGTWDSTAWVKVFISDELSQSSGASSVAQLEDVQLSNLSDNDLLVYDSNLTGGKLWKNAKKIVTCTKAQFDDWSANDTFPYTDCKYIVTDVNNLNTTAADIPYDSTGTDSVWDKIESLNRIVTKSITISITCRGYIRCYQLGKTAFVDININTDSNTTSVGTTIATGFPKPYESFYPRLSARDNNGSYVQVLNFDKNDGTIKTTDTVMQGNTWWGCQFTYFTND